MGTATIIECPDCGDDLPTTPGAECENCGHVYWDEVSVRLFDNHGETFDRYTAVFYDQDGQCVGYRGMSDNPFHPQGFGIWDDGDCSGTIERDTEIAVEDAPEQVQRCIALDLSEIEKGVTV